MTALDPQSSALALPLDGGFSVSPSISQAPRGPIGYPATIPGGGPAALRAARALSLAIRCLLAERRRLRLRERRPATAGTNPARAGAFALSRMAAHLCSANGYRTVVRGPVPEGPVVLVANHLSYVDPLVIAAILPCAPLAKMAVRRWPLVGDLAGASGVAFVDRTSVQSGARGLLAARRALRAGVSVLNFPEGTTTKGEHVLPFRRGVFGLARRLRVPIVPLAISFDDVELCWTGNDLFLPHYLRVAARGGGVVRLRFGYPMTPERYGSADDLAREAHAVVGHMLGCAS